jgi:predicted porin
MQKTLIAFAVASLAATPAFAQNGLVIDGRIDMGVITQDNAQVPETLEQGNERRTAVDQGLWTHSRLRFRGTEDLGDGWKAMVWLENRILADTGTSTPRQHWVALSNDDYGTLQLGRINTPSFDWLMLFDASGSNAFRYVNPALYDTGESWADNAIQYISPVMRGFEVSAYYSKDWMGNEDTRSNRSYGGNLRYANGPLHALYNVQKYETYGFLESRFPSGMYHTLAGYYDFSVIKLFGTAMYNAYKESGLTDTTQWSLGLSVPIGTADTVSLGYGTQSDLRGNAGEDRDTIGLTYKHDLSKRTFGYVGYQWQNPSDKNPSTRLKNINTFGAGVVHYF